MNKVFLNIFFFGKTENIEMILVLPCFYFPAGVITNKLYIHFYGNYQLLKFTTWPELFYNILKTPFTVPIVAFILMYILFWAMENVLLPFTLGFINPVKPRGKSTIITYYILQKMGVRAIANTLIPSKKALLEKVSFYAACMFMVSFMYVGTTIKDLLFFAIAFSTSLYLTVYLAKFSLLAFYEANKINLR